MSETITIPGKELTEAIKDLNSVLEKKDRIKVVGVSNSKKIEQFTETILAIVEGGDEENIPEKAASVYTKYIKEPMNGETEEVEEEEPVAEKKPAAKKGGKKSAKKSDTKADEKPAAKKPAAKKGGKKAAKKADEKPAAKKGGKKPAAKKAEKKEKPSVDRDEFGFSVNTKKHEFIKMISEKPMKMSELKGITGDTYYNTVSAFPDRILKTLTSHFYVKGSAAEKLAKDIEKEALKQQKEAEKAKAEKKANVKKTTTTKKKDTKKADEKPAAKKGGKKPAAKKPAAKKPSQSTKKRPGKKK